MLWEDIAKLDIGDLVEAGALMPALGTEPVVHELVWKNIDKGVFRLRCSYLDIQVGYLIGRKANDSGNISWTFTQETGALA